MSDISEQEPSNTIGELSKALSSEVGKAERVSKHSSTIDTTTTTLAETEERSVNKSSSREINGEDDLETTILNLSKQIQQLKQERLSTSFQHHRFYSNPDRLRLENDLPNCYHSHSQSTKCLRTQAYSKKIKNYSNICSPSYDSQISSYESSSHEEYRHFHDKRVHFLTSNSRKGKYLGKYLSHQSHKKHKKSTSPMKGPTSAVRGNISPVREQRKSPVRELSLSPVREDHSPVRVILKAGKKRQGESNDQEKRKKIKPSKEVFNQYASQTDGYDSEFERESQSLQNLNFDKVQKIDHQCEMGPPLHEKIADIICGNFASRISQTTSKEIEKKFLLPSDCPLSIPLVNSELWRIMSSNQRKGDAKLASLQNSLVKVVAGALNIFTEVQKEKFEIQTIAKMVADITAIVGKVSYDLSLKRRELIKSSLKPEFRSLCSANNEPTELLFGDELTKHVKDLTMTNRLKRSEGYYQSKYITSIQKIMQNLTQGSLF